MRGLICLGIALGIGVVSATASAMSKEELVAAVAKQGKLTKADAGRALDAFPLVVGNRLKKGDRISLVGFGSFSVSKRTALGLCESDLDGDGVCDGDCPDPKGACECSSPWDVDFDEDVVSNPLYCSNVAGEAEVAADLAIAARLSPQAAKDATKSLLNIIRREVKNGEWVDAGGLGTIWIEEHAARVGRNPQTGKEIKIAAKKVVKFKAGTELATSVNKGK